MLHQTQNTLKVSVFNPLISQIHLRRSSHPERAWQARCAPPSKPRGSEVARGHADTQISHLSPHLAAPRSLPPLNLITSLRVRQDEENGDADARPSLPPQRRVTKQIMQEWGRHKITLRNPPDAKPRREAQASLLLTCLVRVGPDEARLDFRRSQCAHN
jgi:hypothetical protein